MKDPLKDYWFQVEIQKSLYRNIEKFTRLDMTEKNISPIGGRWDPIFGVVNPGPHTYKMTPSWRGFVILAPPRLVRLAE